jgi:hypothetical protein
MACRPPVPLLCGLLAIGSARPARAEGPGLDAMIERAAERAGVTRRVQAVGGIVAGSTLLLAGKTLYDETDPGDTGGRAIAISILGSGAIALATAPFALFGVSPLERVAEEIRAIPGAPNDPERLARVDLLLELAARDEQAARSSAAWVSAAIAATFVGFAVNEALSESASDTTRLVRTSTYGAGAAATAVSAVVLAKTAGPIGAVAEAWSIARASGAPCASAVPAASGATGSVNVGPMGAGIAITGAF